MISSKAVAAIVAVVLSGAAIAVDSTSDADKLEKVALQLTLASQHPFLLAMKQEPTEVGRKALTQKLMEFGRVNPADWQEVGSYDDGHASVFLDKNVWLTGGAKSKKVAFWRRMVYKKLDEMDKITGKMPVEDDLVMVDCNKPAVVQIYEYVNIKYASTSDKKPTKISLGLTDDTLKSYGMKRYKKISSDTLLYIVNAEVCKLQSSAINIGDQKF